VPISARLGSIATTAQRVMATCAAGAGVGLILFGELGARFDQRLLLLGSLLAFGGVSPWIALTPGLETMVVQRLLQGAAGSAATVFAPGMLRALYDDHGAIRALGLLGSIESLVPALAPLAGLWLIGLGGWPATFKETGGLSLPSHSRSRAAV